jgi:hypothetical protein
VDVESMSRIEAVEEVVGEYVAEGGSYEEVGVVGGLEPFRML